MPNQNNNTNVLPNQNYQKRSLECHRCGCKHLPVIYFRRVRGRIVRRLECRNCGKQVTVWEKPSQGNTKPETYVET